MPDSPPPPPMLLGSVILVCILWNQIAPPSSGATIPNFHVGHHTTFLPILIFRKILEIIIFRKYGIDSFGVDQGQIKEYFARKVILVLLNFVRSTAKFLNGLPTHVCS
jgi:hypothetical protein